MKEPLCPVCSCSSCIMRTGIQSVQVRTLLEVRKFVWPLQIQKVWLRVRTLFQWVG